MEYQLMEEAPVGYVILKKVRRIGYGQMDLEFADTNRKFEEITGLEKKTILGQRIDDLIEKSGFLYDWLELCRNAAVVGECEADIPCLEREKWYHIHAASFGNAYLAVSFMDITHYMTQIKEAQELILQLKQSVGSQTLKFAEDMMLRHKLHEKNNLEMLHSKRVSLLCEMFAERLNISKDEVRKIKLAGLMHDIGKIGIDEKILNKKENLTELERKEIKRHP